MKDLITISADDKGTLLISTNIKQEYLIGLLEDVIETIKDQITENVISVDTANSYDA